MALAFCRADCVIVLRLETSWRTACCASSVGARKFQCCCYNSSITIFGFHVFLKLLELKCRSAHICRLSSKSHKLFPRVQ